MDMIADFQKSITEPIIGFVVQNPVLFIGVLGLCVIAYFISGVHTTIVMPLFDTSSDGDAGNASDGGDGGGD